MAQPNVTTTVVVPQQSSSLMPQLITEFYHGACAGARTFRRSCEAMERVVIGVDEVCTIALAQQKHNLLAELTKSGGVISLPST